jgi:hypothetical protein
MRWECFSLRTSIVGDNIHRQLIACALLFTLATPARALAEGAADETGGDNRFALACEKMGGTFYKGPPLDRCEVIGDKGNEIEVDNDRGDTLSSNETAKSCTAKGGSIATIKTGKKYCLLPVKLPQ